MTGLSARQRDWLTSLDGGLFDFMDGLSNGDQAGRFLPCREGTTEAGRAAGLGFSCFALKIFVTTNRWDDLPADKKTAWAAYIKSFQRHDGNARNPFERNAFVDRPLVQDIDRLAPFTERVSRRLAPGWRFGAVENAMVAETKQAIASLIEIGDRADHPYLGIPYTREAGMDFLRRLDWTIPWGAGGRAAALAVFIQTQAPEVVSEEVIDTLRRAYIGFMDGICDAATGGYFTGPPPLHGQLVNGAMKVLNALDWMEVPPHFPERLIDTCLSETPKADGCHLVDAVYVLHRCRRVTDHRLSDIQRYCGGLLDSIHAHYNGDGGLSYGIGRSQTHYYGARVMEGRPESDIHGTCLLLWAVAMIVDLMEENFLGWKVIRP